MEDFRCPLVGFPFVWQVAVIKILLCDMTIKMPILWSYYVKLKVLNVSSPLVEHIAEVLEVFVYQMLSFWHSSILQICLQWHLPLQSQKQTGC